MKLMRYREIFHHHRHIIKMLQRYIDEIKSSGKKDKWYIYERNMTAIEGVILKVFLTKGQGEEHIDVIAHQAGLYVCIERDRPDLIEIEFSY